MGNDVATKIPLRQTGYGSGTSLAQPGAGPSLGSNADDAMLQKNHDRNYDPTQDAPRGTTAAKLNEDAARYKNGAPL